MDRLDPTGLECLVARTPTCLDGRAWFLVGSWLVQAGTMLDQTPLQAHPDILGGSKWVIGPK